MLEGEPDITGSDPYDLAKVAALVRGLCGRDRHPTSDWIEGVRAPTEILMFLDVPIDNEWRQGIKAQAPPGLLPAWRLLPGYLLEPKKVVMARVGAKMRAARVKADRRHVSND